MGRYSHHTIVVTAMQGDDYPYAKRAHTVAKKIFKDICQVSPLMPNKFGDCSFAVFPDGSKEGWDTSNQADHARQLFVSELARRSALKWQDIHHLNCDYVEIQFGGDGEPEAKIISHQ